MKVLVEREDVNPDGSGGFGQTPLCLAAGNGRERIVKLLLERQDVYPDTSDMVYERTPLSWTAEDGHEGVVKLLLERDDVNPDSSTKSDQTPLTLAA